MMKFLCKHVANQPNLIPSTVGCSTNVPGELDRSWFFASSGCIPARFCTAKHQQILWNISISMEWNIEGSWRWNNEYYTLYIRFDLDYQVLVIIVIISGYNWSSGKSNRCNIFIILRIWWDFCCVGVGFGGLVKENTNATNNEKYQKFEQIWLVWCLLVLVTVLNNVIMWFWAVLLVTRCFSLVIHVLMLL